MAYSQINFSLFPQFLFYTLKLYYKGSFNSQFCHWSFSPEISQSIGHCRRKCERDLRQKGQNRSYSNGISILNAFTQMSLRTLWKIIWIYSIMILQIPCRNVRTPLLPWESAPFVQVCSMRRYQSASVVIPWLNNTRIQWSSKPNNNSLFIMSHYLIMSHSLFKANPYFTTRINYN